MASNLPGKTKIEVEAGTDENKPPTTDHPSLQVREGSHEEWLTDDIRRLLREIKGEHAAKKRITVIKLAFARANGIPVKRVFNQEDTCAEVIWYTKWAKNPAIKAAYEACCQRALEWVDEQTAALEVSFRLIRRQSVARYAALAPREVAAVMKDTKQIGLARINAAKTLMNWVNDQELGGGPGQPRKAEDFSDDELAAIAARGGE